MFKRKNVLSLILAFLLILPNTIVLAEELLPETQTDLMDTGLSIPERDSSIWALDELVDSDRYGLYKVEDFYKNNLKSPLNDELREELLKNFEEKLENTNLEKIEKPEFLVEVKNPKTRAGFLRQIYNVLTSYESENNLGKDPIMYLNHVGILAGDGKELFLDRNITIEEGIIFIKRAIDHIYNENNLDTQGLMWKVENKGNTVYLLGSIHYGKPEIYPFRKDILNNFADSETLYVEVDITNQEKLMEIMLEELSKLEEEFETNSRYQDGTTLKSVVDEEIYSKIENIMDKYNIAKEEYENFKIQGIEGKLNEIIIEETFKVLPDEDEEQLQKELEESMEELLDNELMRLLVEGPKYGIDLYFLDKAKTLNKKVEELESIESQMELLFGGGLFGDFTDNISEEEQLEFLKETLENFDDEGNIIEREEFENEEELDEDFNVEMEQILQEQLEEQLNIIEGMFDAIQVGDAEKLVELLTESGSLEALGGQLIGDRDKNMAEKIGNLLEGKEEKTYFIVVGAAHFIVDGTILDNLTNMGYKIERIN